MGDDDHTWALRGLLAAVSDLAEVPHAGPVGRVLLAVAVAGKGCSDDTVARSASMPVDAVREVLPSMLVRCLQVPPLLTAKANPHRLGLTYSGIRLTGEGSRRIIKLREYLTRQ